MNKLRVGIIDLTSKGPTRAFFARLMAANFASIMPQAVGAWCAQLGHRVSYVCYTGFENLLKDHAGPFDVVFIGAFTEAAQTAYALSSFYRSKGAVTVLGGPHARCYPQDAQKYFDFVVGFTNKTLIQDILLDCEPHRPFGIHLSADGQPSQLPSVRERWPFAESTLKKVPWLPIVPLIGSLGCPYTCSFCIDAQVPYQPLDFGLLKEDLRFLLTKFKRPKVSWHDPNFAVRFNDYMDAIEEAVPAGHISFIAESSLSLLSEPHLKRLKHNGCVVMVPGIESWFDLGNKSKTNAKQGMEKVRQISEHVNLIQRYIPYVQTNFVLGLDSDDGAAPFELTKEFLKRAPGAFPGYSLLTAFGQAAPQNLSYQRDGRVLPFPFHFLNNNQAMNVKPKNYSWPQFYDLLVSLTRYSFSWRAIGKRLHDNKGTLVRSMNFVRSVSSEGFGRLRYHKIIRKRLDSDSHLRAYFEQETTELPRFYVELIRKDLGPLWHWLPKQALNHDPHAYLRAEGGGSIAGAGSAVNSRIAV